MDYTETHTFTDDPPFYVQHIPPTVFVNYIIYVKPLYRTEMHKKKEKP